MYKVNLNEYVKFKLTEKGNKILEEYTDYMNVLTGITLTKEHFLKVDDNEMEYMQTWQFMNIFGQHFHNGADPIVEDNNLYFD